MCPNPQGIHHVSQIYAGLYALQSENKVKISFSSDLLEIPPDLLSLKNSNRLLWTEIESIETGQLLKVCFDLRDTGDILAETLQRSDVYLKRSYSCEWISKSKIAQCQQHKIMPYGLYYPCKSEHQMATYANRITTLKHLVSYQIANKQFLQGSRSIYRKVSFDRMIPVTQIETGSEVPAEELVLFQTRVYDPKGFKDDYIEYLNIEELNSVRVKTIRALKDKFGRKFIGGLKKTKFSEREYPDCITPFETEKNEYIKLLKRCLITITNSGLVGSNGAKLAEYVAASRCIITEPLRYELPTPLEEGTNIMTFRSPEECVSACERIFQDSDLADRMRRSNKEYYNKESKPSVLILNCLDRSFTKDRNKE